MTSERADNKCERCGKIFSDEELTPLAPFEVELCCGRCVELYTTPSIALYYNYESDNDPPR